MSDHALPLRLVEEDGHSDASQGTARVESYRRLADVFHDVLAEQSLDALLDRIADALAELVPHDSLTIYEADEPRRLLIPVWARDKWADKILADSCPFGVGLTGWGVEHRESVLVNKAHLDPRTATVAGTPEDEPEALITIPLIARDSIKGALNIYRLGDDAAFDEDEFELAKRFGDAAALALDNAQIRARLEHQAQTDPLTGLFNHRAFHERLRQALANASRSHDAVSLLMLDIDDFKRVNDVYGHGAGDEILRSLADTLKDAVRTSDVVYRLGGEEFAIVIASRSRAERRASCAPARRTCRGHRVRSGRPHHDLGRACSRSRARHEPARADRLCGGGDDDRKGPGQEPDHRLSTTRSSSVLKAKRFHPRATFALSRT